MRGHGIGTAPTFLQHCVHTCPSCHKMHSKSGAFGKKISAVILATPEQSKRAGRKQAHYHYQDYDGSTPHRTGALLHKRKLQKSRKSRPFPLDLGTNLNTNQVRVSAITKWYCDRGYLSSCRVSPVAHVVPGTHPRYHLPLPPRCREPPPKEGRGGVPQHNLSLPI